MKKIFACLTAAVLSISMTVSAFAAAGQSSVEVDGIVTAINSATDANGNPVQIVVRETPEEYRRVMEEIKDIELVEEILGDRFVEGMEVIDVKDVYAVGNPSFPVTINFAATGITTSNRVEVLHYLSDEKEWEIVESKAGNGSITATFNSLSPVAFIADTKSSGGGSEATGKPDPNVTSPKTGESSAMTYAGIIACAAVVGMGAVVLRKKKHE